MLGPTPGVFRYAWTEEGTTAPKAAAALLALNRQLNHQPSRLVRGQSAAREKTSDQPSYISLPRSGVWIAEL